MLLSYFGAIAPLTNSLENSVSNILCKLNPGQHQILNNKILNNQNYKDQFAYWAFTGEVDYYSTKSKTLGMRQEFQHGMQLLKIQGSIVLLKIRYL